MFWYENALMQWGRFPKGVIKWEKELRGYTMLIMLSDFLISHANSDL